MAVEAMTEFSNDLNHELSKCGKATSVPSTGKSAETRSAARALLEMNERCKSSERGGDRGHPRSGQSEEKWVEIDRLLANVNDYPIPTSIKSLVSNLLTFQI